MSNLDHIFGDVMGELENLLPSKYKVVASYNGGAFEKIDTAKTKQAAERLVAEYKMSYGEGWRVIYYNIED